MPHFNFAAILIAALVPLIVGSLWYSSSFFGRSIAIENGLDPDVAKPHSPLVYILTFIASFLIAMLIAAILGGHAREDITLSHGLFHGGGAAIFMGIPTFMVIALFESKSAKYIFIHGLYWLVSFAIMGGIIGYIN